METRKKISLAFLFLAIFLILGVGTQTFAKKVGYHKSLGKPLFIYKKEILARKINFLAKIQKNSSNSYPSS